MRVLLGVVLVVALVCAPPAPAQDACGPTGVCAADGILCDEVIGPDRCYVVQRLIDDLLP
ncbi:MAG TPA: hypothetical protein VNX21_06460 [Candidatus Thermoplasmatota archaeon]|nr:hypothetical protein [Candidatus Thermoplasmatota archaeon]